MLLLSVFGNALAFWALSDAQNRSQGADDKATYQMAKWIVGACAVISLLVSSRNED